ncbi:MAG: hypothetical protein U0350_21295 [Caldilineaceae bacterium]
MSNKKSLLLIILLGSIALLVLAPLVERGSKASGIPDTPDTREIMAVMEHAYTLLRTPVERLDVNQFAEVFTNNADYKHSQEKKDYIGKILGAGATKNIGYLTFLQARYTHLQHGAQLLRAGLDKAKAQKRELTAEAYQALAQQNYDSPPPDLQDPNAPVAKPILQYEPLEINGDQAIARYDSGPALEEATLVRTKGRWYISSIKIINAHF